MGSKLPDHIDGLISYISQQKEKANEDLILKYFRKVFGTDFYRQDDAQGSDGYVPGHFVLELKGTSKDWLSGLFQGIAYQRKLDFSIVVIAAKNFLAAWKVEDIDESIREEIFNSKTAPNMIGKSIAKKYKSKKDVILKKSIWNLRSELTDGLFALDSKNIIKEIKSFESTLKKQKRDRRKITTRNFTSTLKEMVQFFDKEQPIKTIRAFYSMIFGWGKDSNLEISNKNKTQATLSGELIEYLDPGKRVKFKEFVENHYVFLKGDESLDDFFTQYDKAIDSVDPKFRRKHGIFFTDLDLSRFVMWFTKSQYKEISDVGENYLVIDPACGSGNLVTNWRSPLEIRHKVVSEIEPELLFAVEKRMMSDDWHDGKYTVIPKVAENKGLNFLDKSAEEYLNIIRNYLLEKGHNADKPIAILCNPPYRNDDDQKAESTQYSIHESIMDLVGKDPSAERSTCFLAQMRLLAKEAKERNLKGDTLLLIFTGIPWMTKRPLFKNIRKSIFQVFENVGGIIVNSREFFDVPGKFPIAFTIWKYKGEDANLNTDRNIKLIDLTRLKKSNLSGIDWTNPEIIDKHCEEILNDKKSIIVDIGLDYQNIREWAKEKRFDFQREKTKAEKDEGDTFKCGLPNGDKRHKRKKTLGHKDGKFIGFMDDLTPCRIRKETNQNPWFRLNTQFMEYQRTRCFSGPADNRSFCAYDLESAKKLFFWYTLSRTFRHHRYPMWANNLEMWGIPDDLLNNQEFLKFCFSITYAENECIDMIFPANNPELHSPEIRLKNPMSPNNANSFWNKYLVNFFNGQSTNLTNRLVERTNNLYQEWAGRFKNSYEIYVDFDQPYFVDQKVLRIGSGIVQIKNYTNEYQDEILIDLIIDLQEVLKDTKSLFYEYLLDHTKFNYFGSSKGKSTNQDNLITPLDVTQARAALASYIVNELHKEITFGRTKFAKIFFIIDSEINENLNTNYYREAAGPLDPYSLYNKKSGIEKTSSDKNYFSTIELIENKRKRIRYVPGNNISNGKKLAEKHFKKNLKEIKKIINLLRNATTEQCEIVATIYACWNDLIIEGKKVSDDIIINEFYYQWHKEKLRFKEDRLRVAIQWMRNKGIIPTGKGKRTNQGKPPNQKDLFDFTNLEKFQFF